MERVGAVFQPVREAGPAGRPGLPGRKIIGHNLKTGCPGAEQVNSGNGFRIISGPETESDSMTAGTSLKDFDYELPPELIAAVPAAERDQARMLVVDRQRRTWEHRHFWQLPEILTPEDVIVVNDTRVFPARLRGRKATGGVVELLLAEPLPQSPNGKPVTRAVVRALGRAAKPFRVGQEITCGDRLTATVLTVGPDGELTVALNTSGEDVHEVVAAIGEVPLPPYLRRPLEDFDRTRYQTIFARVSGAVAAPTAGLHFTPGVLAALESQGIQVVSVTLHVGPGTFQPIREEDYTRHRLRPEYFCLSPASAAALNAARQAGKKIVAVGTTTVRLLEARGRTGILEPGTGEVDLYIYPGFTFRIVDKLLTNFHLPRSSLLLLVSAFAGRELILAAYQAAIAARYRFYSYGDCMLII